MPISIGEWRVRIGRFVRWQREPVDIKLVPLLHEPSDNAETPETKDSSGSCGVSSSGGSQCNNMSGEAGLSGDGGSLAAGSNGSSKAEGSVVSTNPDDGVSQINTPLVDNTSGSQTPSGHDQQDISSDPANPDVTEVLLLRAGDVESNPGPNDGHSSSDDKGEFDDILKSVAHQIPGNQSIDDLGKALSFDPVDIERYQATNTRSQRVTYDGTLQMLRDWRKTQKVAQERSALIDALIEAGLVRLADKIVPTNEPTRRCVPPTLDDMIDQVVEDTKRYYMLDLCTIQADPLDNQTLFDFGDIFTNLTLLEIEDNMHVQRKIPLTYSELLKTKVRGILARRLLVEGEGGSGKTTFCSKIAWDWAKGIYFTQFKLVVVVPLRKAKDKTVGEIVQTYLSDNNPIEAEQINQYIISNPQEVLLVLDGLDEFNGDFEGLNQVVQIILNKVFQSGTVVVTTRQSDVHVIRSITALRKVYSCIAIEGFSADNVASYIRKFFQPDTISSEELIDFVATNEVIKDDMAPFPIYIAMLCIMWKEFDGERREAMSKLSTFIQLFSEMITFLVDHYLSKDESHARISLKERTKNVLSHLTAIGKIALQGLEERRLVFPEDTFQTCKESMEIGCKVGVLTRDKHDTPRRERRSRLVSTTSMVQFPHKLFQEYLSALYFASLHNSDPSEYENLMADIMQKAEQYQYLLYFTSAQDNKVGVDIVNRLIEKESDGDLLVAVTRESQDPSIAKDVGRLMWKSSDTLEITKGRTLSGYLFIMEHWGGVIERLKVYSINLCERPAASSHLAEFMCKMSHLKTVQLGDSRLHDHFYETAASVGSSAKIEDLTTSNIDLSERPAASTHLAEFMCKMSHLKTFELDDSRLHDNFYETAASVGSRAKIERLTMNHFDLSERPAASSHLAEFICIMSHLNTFELESSELHDHFYETAASVGSSAKIERLTMGHIDLSELPAASDHLAEFMCQMSHLKTVESVGSMLHDNFYRTAASVGSSAKIEHLIIEDSDLSERPAASSHLAEFICKLSHLKSLLFPACDFHEDFYQSSVPLGPLGKVDDHSNSNHTYLNEIISNDGTLLTIKFSDELESGHLQGTHGLQGATELIIQKRKYTDGIACLKGEPSSMLKALLSVFPQLTKMTFSDIDIGNADMKLILESLRSSQNLRLNNFSVIRCNTDEELDAFVRDLASNVHVEVEHGEPTDEDEDEDSDEDGDEDEDEDGDEDGDEDENEDEDVDEDEDEDGDEDEDEDGDEDENEDEDEDEDECGVLGSDVFQVGVEVPRTNKPKD